MEFLWYVVTPLLIISVYLGWWAQKQTIRKEMKVLMFQLMVDAMIIAFFLIYFFQIRDFLFMMVAGIYLYIISARTRAFIDKVDDLT